MENKLEKLISIGFIVLGIIFFIISPSSFIISLLILFLIKKISKKPFVKKDTLVFVAIYICLFLIIKDLTTIKTANISTQAPAPPVVKQPIIQPKHKPVLSPEIASKFFEDSMPTGVYKDYQFSICDFGDYGTYCSNSDYRKLKGHVNNIAYYVYGDYDKVRALSLTLNVHALEYKRLAINELVKSANILTLKLTNQPLPNNIKQALINRASGEWTLKGCKIRLIQEYFENDFMTVFLIEV